MPDRVELFTDGACKGNPGPGGWGAVLRYGAREKELFGGEATTTNNRMELTAVIEGLRALKQRCSVDITTDSQYVKNGITQWIHNWKRNGWRTAAKKPVKNDDLWRQLDEAVQQHDVRGARTKVVTLYNQARANAMTTNRPTAICFNGNTAVITATLPGGGLDTLGSVQDLHNDYGITLVSSDSMLAIDPRGFGRGGGTSTGPT